MKIAILGAGAVGCVLAARLRKAGEDVTLVGREDQVHALNTKGLTVKRSTGIETVDVRAEVRLGAVHDVVVLATKTQDVEHAVQSNRRYLDGCSILTTQNGVRADAVVADHVNHEQLISSIVMFGATYTKAGEVTHNFDGQWIMGRPFPLPEPMSPCDADVDGVAEVMGRAFDVVVTRDIMAMKYLKLFVNFNNCVPALIGRSMQATFSDMDFCRLCVMLLREGVEMVRSAGIEMVSLPDFPKERICSLVSLPIDQAARIISRTLTGLSHEPLYGSILQSILRGKDSEIDFINGEVVRMADRSHAQAPLNRRMVDMVHEVERTGRFFSAGEVKEAFELHSGRM